MKRNYHLPTIVNLKKIILILVISFLSSLGYSQSYFEGFESGTTLPAGWAVFDNGVGTAQSWQIINSPAAMIYEGANSARVLRENTNSGPGTTEDWLVTDAHVIPTNGQFRFFTRSNVQGDAGTLYQIRISSTSQTDPSTFTTIQTYTENELGILSGSTILYEEKVINMAAWAGQTKYIAFVKVNTQVGIGTTGDMWLVDNVSLVEKCPDPTVLTVNNITSTTAILGWSSTASLFDIEIGPIGFTPGTGTIVASVTNPYMLTGLLPATGFQFCVKAKCADGTESECVGPFNFTTKPLGSVCNDPITIAALPYQVLTDNTGNYGDEVDVIQGTLCGATPSGTNYLAGDEVFYSFVATATGPVSVTMTPQGTTSTNSSVFVYEGCSNFPVTCLGGVANTGTAPRVVSLNVTAGMTYTIVISSSAATQTVTYGLLIQQENCVPKPTGLPTTTTLTSADLAWTSIYTTAQVFVQPLGTTVPTGPGTAVTGTTYTATQLTGTTTDLTAGTQYQYWVRGECTPGSGIFTAWAGPYPFNTNICDPVNACTHTFRMTDLSNDGWNNARMQIRQNGIVVATIGATYTSGAGPVDIPVQLCNGMPFDIYWSVAGTQPQQCILAVINSFGQTIYTKAAGASSPGDVVYTNIANCTTPLCSLAPTNTIATNIANYSATIGWTAPATTAWDVYFAPTGTPAPTTATVPTYANVTTNSLDITGLIADNSYDVYIRTICSPMSSPWSAVYTFTTLATCPKPTALTAPVATITQTEALLGWTNGTPTDTLWEILLVKASPGNNYGTPPTPTLLPVLGPGDILYTPVTTTTSPSTFLATGLQPATIYYYYIRTVCSATDNSTWAGPIKFNTVTCADADKCTYKFVLTDAGSNGWNGGRMQVRQNGIVVATLGPTMTGAGPTTVSVAICNNVPFDLNWNIHGTNPEEIGLTIQNPFTDIIYTMVPGAVTPPTGTPLVPVVVYSSIGNCTPPTCPKPTALFVFAMTQTSAELSWTEMGTATQWEVYVAPTGAPAPVNGTPLGTAPPYYLATTNPFTVTGLQPSTYYTYYVRALCSATDISTWTILNPKSFHTKPVNDECEFATPVPVNPTKVCAASIAGTTLGSTASVDGGTTCAGTEDDDVWFSFVATNNIHIITLSNIIGSTDLNHTLYSGSDCATMTQMYCSNPNVSVAANLTVGNTYLVRVYTNGSVATESATFDICITTPPPVTNDECATATPAATNTGLACIVATPGTLTGATASADGGTTCVGVEDDDVWFSFVANSNTQYLSLINVLGTSTDLNHAVYSGVCGSLTLKYCSAVGTLSSNNAAFVMGQTYYIRVWSNSNVAQDITFDLCIGKIPPPLTVSTSAYNAEELITNVLMNNSCTIVSNVTSSTGTNFGSVNGIGSFDGSLSNFPFTNGIVLSTGNALSVPGPNMSILNGGTDAWPGDASLEAILAPAGMTLNSKNASKLEFDFVPSADEISFNFLYASEDYGVFQCSFSDAFACILTDLTTGSAVNLAVVPGTTTPISALTIRSNAFNGACTSVNPQYFDVGYMNPTPPGISPLGAPINFNGLTVPMTASSAVISGHTYHIKMVIADHNDTGYDSAVFLQGGSFISGEPDCLDKIKLVAFVDGNANGIKDSNEGSFAHGSFVMQQNNTGTPTNISSPDGNYTLYDDNPVNTYDFSYQINPEFANYYAATATNFNDINIPVGSVTQTLYFPITVTQAYNDVSVTIIPSTQPRPGLTYTNKIVYKNLGIATTSGTLTFTKPAPTTITYIGQTGTVSNTTGFTYDFSNLAPNETRNFYIIMSVPAIPTVNIGNVLTASASISAPANDFNLVNNVFTNNQIVVGSYDPNDKMEAHGEKILFSSFGANEYLTYTIRFQNTGTAHAITVRLEDVLDSKLDPTSIRMVSASHNYVMTRVNNAITWQFDDIQLPYATLNEELSNGYVTFQVKLLPGFAVGDIVPNHADIYFDANPAIITNTFNTEFVAALKTITFNAENILIYPNPANEVVNIRLENTMENLESVILYDMIGKSVFKTTNIDSNQSAIDVSALAKGMYLVEITTVNQLKMTKKLIVK